MLNKRPSIREKISIMLAKNPAGVILIGILLLNVFFFTVSALVISALAPESLRNHGFWASVFYTVSMILDAGCISYVVEDVGQASVALIIACMATVIIGSITFTGAVIGYVTNYISDFIGSSNAGEHRLHASGHTIILNWNSRASEIINDLLYSESPEVVVVLVSDGKEAVEREIAERLANTLDMEAREIRQHIENNHLGFFAAWRYNRKHNVKNRVTVIVREGDTFSTQKLNDISIKSARSIIILGKDIQNSVCKYDMMERAERNEKGNTNTIKTLIQVAELTGRADSANNQKIVVETEDEWTLNLVNQIIAHKEKAGKCNIVPLAVNRILGQILSQFSIMPELNIAYGDMFSNKGAAFYCENVPVDTDTEAYISRYLKENRFAVPMNAMSDGENGKTFYYLAESTRDVKRREAPANAELCHLELNPDYWMTPRYIIILGHNSKSRAIMSGFNAFRGEWNYRTPEQLAAAGGNPEILHILAIDDERSLDKLQNYKEYPQVVGTLAADIYDKDRICDQIDRFIDSHEGDTSILILSDDTVTNEEMDANALTYLIYVQEIISRREKADPNFIRESIDVVVEILNPKNYDIVRSYDIDNIVISNRYLSKMITQIGEKDNIYCFYNDILTYDDGDSDEPSKELYVKTAGRFFSKMPGKCTASQLVRAIYEASPAGDRAVLCGYVRPASITNKTPSEMVIFSGDLDAIEVELQPADKLILFANH